MYPIQMQSLFFLISRTLDLSHTADIQFHSCKEHPITISQLCALILGGFDLIESFEQIAMCMFSYMTELEKVDINAECTTEVSVESHDLQSLLYKFLDELLFIFSTERLICKAVKIKQLVREEKEKTFSILATA
jgi:hypothetical protein